eukprot:1220544-Heterocapsa_arctica.AAC.1
MLLFRSRVYVCTASAERWGITGESAALFDAEAKRVWHLANDKGITVWTGRELHDDLTPFKLANNAFHHGEPGKITDVVYIWDRIFHRITTFFLA